GYHGNVITDWWMQYAASPEFPELRGNAYRVRARVDVLMPGGKCFEDRSFQPDGTLLETYGKPGGGYIFCTSNVPFKGMPPERYRLILDVWKRMRDYD
ncbi:MAG: hypothetical protein ACI4XW_09725, partial [Candidatus Spyradocola sp.]